MHRAHVMQPPPHRQKRARSPRREAPSRRVVPAGVAVGRPGDCGLSVERPTPPTTGGHAFSRRAGGTEISTAEPSRGHGATVGRPPQPPSRSTVNGRKNRVCSSGSVRHLLTCVTEPQKAHAGARARTSYDHRCTAPFTAQHLDCGVLEILDRGVRGAGCSADGAPQVISLEGAGAPSAGTDRCVRHCSSARDHRHQNRHGEKPQHHGRDEADLCPRDRRPCPRPCRSDR